MGRVLVIGLDGFGYDFAARAFARGLMPFVASRARAGVFVPAASTIPPVSTAAWTTVATGVGVGRHGVVDFQRRPPANYGFAAPGRLVTRADVRTPALYERAAVAGLCSLIVNLPVSYPAAEIKGVVITGMLTPPGSRRGYWPPDFAAHMEGYAYDLDGPVPGDLEDLCRRLEEITAGRVRVVAAACRRERFDFGLVVFTGPDRLFHRHYDEVYAAAETPAPAARYLRALDDACARVYADFGDDATLLICSDHGFGPGPAKNFYTNRLLLRAGLLAVGGSAAWNYVLGGVRRLLGSARALPVAWPRTAAYAFPLYMRWGGVMLNVRGEQPAGRLAPGEVGAFTERIKELLTSARDGAAPIVTWAKGREELYAGPALADLPHVVFEAVPAYAVSEAKGPGPLVGGFTDRRKVGEHTPGAMFLAAGPGIRPGEVKGVALADVTATAARLLGLDAREMDGKPRDEIIV